MNKETDRRWMKIRTTAVLLATFLLVAFCIQLVNRRQEQEDKLKAAYTAESTVNQVETQLSRYLAESDLMKRIIESGYTLEDDEFSRLSALMKDEDQVIEAYELAKDGAVSQVYPLEGNEDAVGLDMLTYPPRKKEAELARDSGQYTIAGPFQLVQGGTGVLLFDPIYTGDEENQKFWGFSILVLNWERFIQKVELNRLGEAGYCYQIWKEDPYTGEKLIIGQSQEADVNDALEVVCEVPNGTWYFEIAPEDGWTPKLQRLFGLALSLLLACLAAVGYWQASMRRYRELRHAEEMEQAAARARMANEAKTRFLFNMSHDIRTPMNAIIGFSELLEKHIDEKDRVLEYVGKLKASGNFLLSIINYVLEMARIESGKATLKRENGDLRELVESLQAVFEPSVQEKGLHYECRMQVKHERLLCDRTKVREIILNVVSNSIKYTPEGGSITLTITEEPEEREGFALYRIVVEDTGIGMSEEYLPHIFEEFTREHTSTESRVSGTGLGLPIVKSLVELMDGTIDVESRLGEGTKTTIVIPFPIAEQETKEAKEKPVGCPEALKGRRILIAEDNDLNAEITETVLQESGFETERAGDGVQCVEMVKQALEDWYDAILMDIQMPRKNGYEAAREIRSLAGRRGSVPIIAMTANAFEEDRRKAFEAGMNAHIGKPIHSEDLIQILWKIIGTEKT